jgi:Flp pilus assembly protein TadD
MESQKSKNAKTQAVKPAPAGKAPAPVGKAPAPAPVRVPPLFRRIDWFTLEITFAIVWVVYFLTLAPEQTLEDSGELCTGAFYAGIPHPPGYPFWAIYAWLWTVVLPFGNVAWRVEVGEATAAAMACGLVAIMVSRGSSMLMEGIEELKNLTGKWENAICSVSGTVAGLLLGFGGVMWSESVAINRISLFGVPWVMVVLLCLMRWIYAPHQRRYLYIAMFFFGICATIHQTLLVAAMGIEITVISVQPKLGRDLLLANSILYVLGLIGKATHFTNMLDTAQMVLVIFHIVGISSTVGWIWLALKTNSLLTEWKAVILMSLLWLAGASFYFYEAIAGMTDPPMQWGYPRTVEGFFHALQRGQYERANPSDFIHDPGRFIMQLGMLVSDIAHEYNWVCLFIALVPLLFFLKMQKRERSWMICLTGIYFFIGVLLLVLMNPSPDRQSADLNRVFFTSSHGVIAIMIGYGLALTAAYMATHYQRFRIMALMLGVVTLMPACVTFYNGVSNTFFGGVGVLSARLEILLFICLAASFVLAAMAAQKAVRTTTAPDAPPGFDPLFLVFACAAVICLGVSITVAFWWEKDRLHFNQIGEALAHLFAPHQYSLPAQAGLLVLCIVAAFMGSLLVYRQRAPLVITLGLFALIPLSSGLSHWAACEQRNHWFGYWFGHDMFTPPFIDKDGKLNYDPKLREQAAKGANGNLVYPEMTKDTILFGGTDPGRFCPTYAIFCDSFIPHDCQPVADQNFDRRDVYIITQNALADNTYLEYIRAHYYRSDQYKYDTPFFSELARYLLKDKEYETNLLARLVSPLDTLFTGIGASVEKRRRTSTSLFGEKDFIDLSGLAARLRPGASQDPLSKWLYANFSKETQDLLTGQGDETRLRKALAVDLNRLLERELEVKKSLTSKQQEKNAVDMDIATGDTSEGLRRRQGQLGQEITGLSQIGPLYETNRFAGVKLSDYILQFIAQNPQTDTRIRLNRLLLEAAYPKEIARSLGGVYPDREIYTPTPEDSQYCFRDYMADAQHRIVHDQQFPNEQKQVKLGEDVKFVNDESGQQRVQVSGQIAVMAINGLLTKVIFDHNPNNEFFIEESFPLDWMYAYLTPYGIIMKINRQPLPEITEDIVKRDHEFWSKYSERLIGNWITYDTPVKDIAAWIEKTYLRHDYTGFKGDVKFVHDDQAQKAFSKLRSSIGGIYGWRIGLPPGGGSVPAQYLARTEPAHSLMMREADFTYKQAFAFCPYSPEAVSRFVNLLLVQNRLDDALLVVQTCVKLDPYNDSMIDLANRIQGFRQPGDASQMQSEVGQLEKEVSANPSDLQKAFDLASKYMQLQDTNRAFHILDSMVNDPHVPPAAVLSVAQAYIQMRNYPKVEATLEKLTRLTPDQPEAWYDLAATKAVLGKSSDALQSLRRSLELSTQRLVKNPGALDLRTKAASDDRFAGLHRMPEFQALVRDH